MLLLQGCAGVRIHTAHEPGTEERFCAWFGDAHGDTLYFGQAAFWSAFRASGGDPRSVLDREGPARVGRFDLVRERLLEPLDVSAGGDRSGVWDVLAHANGRLYFTSFFESAGWVDPRSGATHRLEALGTGLNEIAHGPDGALVVSRYARGGSVVLIDAQGALLAEYPLDAPAGYAALPKTVAFDPSRGEIWVTTDLLPHGEDAAARHDAIVLDATGREVRRIETPEIQFAVFAPDGTGYRAEVEDGALALRIVPPAPADPGGGRLVRLDDDFPAKLDFVQDIQLHPDGRAVVARWNGSIHVVGHEGSVRSLRLPSLEPGGVYYTAALTDGRVCATYCGDVTVVCADLP